MFQLHWAMVPRRLPLYGTAPVWSYTACHSVHHQVCVSKINIQIRKSSIPAVSSGLKIVRYLCVGVQGPRERALSMASKRGLMVWFYVLLYDNIKFIWITHACGMSFSNLCTTFVPAQCQFIDAAHICHFPVLCVCVRACVHLFALRSCSMIL